MQKPRTWRDETGTGLDTLPLPPPPWTGDSRSDREQRRTEENRGGERKSDRDEERGYIENRGEQRRRERRRDEER